MTTIFDTIDLYSDKGLKLLLERFNNGLYPTMDEAEILCEELGELVRNMKAAEASCINQENIEDQIRYLLGVD